MNELTRFLSKWKLKVSKAADLLEVTPQSINNNLRKDHPSKALLEKIKEIDSEMSAKRTLELTEEIQKINRR